VLRDSAHSTEGLLLQPLQRRADAGLRLLLNRPRQPPLP
jgi:hypothetical protein